MEAYVRAGGLPDNYRCEVINRTYDDWLATGTRNVSHGIYCLVFGIIGNMLYVPCLIVFTHRDLFHLPVYKLFLLVTICDIVNLNTNSTLNGIFLIKGVVYCNFPTFIYIWGTFQAAAWGGGCLGCFFLVLTRFVDVIAPAIYTRTFAGNRICFTFFLIFLYILWFILYTKPILFNSTVGTWFTNPMIYENGEHSEDYTSLLIIVNNLVTVTSTLILCIAFFAGFSYKLKNTYDFKMDSLQKQISILIIQSCLICLNNVFVAAIFVYVQFFPVGPFMVVVAESCWELSSVGGVFVFYGINKTVRRRIFSLFGISRSTNSISSTTTGHKPSIIRFTPL